MIRIARGPEPAELQRERRCRLARAILARHDGMPVDFTGYEVAKPALVAALHEKCAFCEKDLRREGNPVEHFRPKACVKNEGEVPDASRYWWLAWTWENLLFACDRCNASNHKGTKFPLAAGTSPLAELSFDLETEQPLLIDPARTDPREHIRFRWSERRQRWFPEAVQGSVRGDTTIRILGLDEDDHPSRHVEDRVGPQIEELREQMQHGDPTKVRNMWDRKMRSLFARRQPVHAVTWDALDAAFPADERQRWGLELPRLGTEAEPSRPSVPFVDPPASAPLLTELSEDLALCVRALGDRALWDEIRPILEQLMSLRTWTDEELGCLLGRDPRTIRTYRRVLPTSVEANATLHTADEDDA
jgi:uncharacterized protein (TIGR02646 family)